MNIKKFLKITIAIIALLLLLAAALAVACVVSSGRSGTVTAECDQTQIVNGELGQTIKLAVNCQLPWAQQLIETSFTPGKGMVQSGNIKQNIQEYTLHGRLLRLQIPVSAYRTGLLEPGILQLTIARPWFKTAPKQITIPIKFADITIAATAVGNRNQLPLADELSKVHKPAHHYYYWLAGGGLLAAVIVLWLIIRQHKRNQHAISQPPWVIASEQLNQLRQTASNGSQPLAWCVAKLTDVVRSYLSKQFQLPAQQQTTEEFFTDLQQKNSPLNSQQISYLKEFMRSADLVKFANIKPDAQTFYQAVDRAEELVQETGLAENEKTSAISTENHS